MTTVALFRPHRGNIDESMKKQSAFTNLDSFIKVINEHYDFTQDVKKQDIEVKYQCLDQRNGWESHIITLKSGGVIGFTNVNPFEFNAPLNRGDFIACANFEEKIGHFGEGVSPDLALTDFIQGGEFNDYCDSHDIADGDLVEVRVFNAIYRDSPDANEEDFEEGWQWRLGSQVGSINIQYLP
ncbi:hypothetical protein QTV49_000582 [Vibrio vulnificus]|nr:hypothetical protein [Vibrio vulnificus]